eukprot:GHVQ01040994.1.p1 GENE.GHVQ01040994.1~~GHVQ01040994.1.p1  ORF type:complete len:167 (+),score=26.48 GHVQ01040994.1:555-1055(+)
MLSLPATKGFEIGSGFQGVSMRGSEHNDLFVVNSYTNNSTRLKSINNTAEIKVTSDVVYPQLLSVKTNHAGGTLGGISTGEDIVFRVAIKAASSIARAQETCTFSGEPTNLSVEGRHDPCVVPRAPALIESMAALVIADLTLRQRARTELPLRVLRPPSADTEQAV